MKALPLTTILLLLTGALLPLTAHAGNKTTPRFRCPAHYVCSGSLGVGIRPPSRWIRLPARKDGPCTLAFARPTVSYQTYEERLLIKIVEVGNTTHDRALAQEYARTFVRRFYTTRATMVNATYGGTPAVVVRGLPPTPRPAVYIVISYTALVYLFTAPGKALGTDQRQALASLRFLIRSGTGCPAIK